MSNINRSQIRKVYSSLHNEANLVSNDFRGMWTSIIDYNKERYWNIIDLLETESNQNDDALEIGSFPGQLSVILKQTCFPQLNCIDIDPSKIENLYSKYNINVKRCNIETEPLPYASDSMDIIIFTELLEHMRINLLYTLREINRVLKPGGSLILSTPNITPANRLKFFLGYDYQENPVSAFKTLERIGLMGHIRLYTESEARKLLEATGFKVKYVKYSGKVIRKWHMKLLLFPYYLVHPHKAKFRKHMYLVASK